MLSAISVAIDTATPVRDQLGQRGIALAIACFVPFDLLGYLGAVVLRNSPWWTLVLLVVPLVTLLVATRAITRGREDARRLTVLLEAAVRVQSIHESDQIGEALLYDARRLVRLKRRRAARLGPGPSSRSAPRYGAARTRCGSWRPPGTGPAPRSPPTSRRSTRWRCSARTPTPGSS